MTAHVAKGRDDHVKVFVAHGTDRFNALADPSEQESGYPGGNEMAFYPDKVFLMVQKL